MMFKNSMMNYMMICQLDRKEKQIERFKIDKNENRDLKWIKIYLILYIKMMINRFLKNIH